MQPLPPDAPSRIGDYLLLAGLGCGAMGSVFLARSRGGRPVAVKVARPELADNSEFRERFRREVEMARSVGGFWTATVVDADPDAERPWMATEYVPGPTLQQAVQEHGPLPERAVRRLAGGLAEALVAIHGAGLVHRDLKPSNVLLAADGPRVIDFGIARALEHSALTEAGIVFGTPGYLSPEQVVGAEITSRSDVFALGSILVYAATGAGPFGEGATSALVYRVVHQDPDLARIPPGLAPLIKPCLARDPADRLTPSRLLELVGPPSAEPSWLPERIRSLVEARHTELSRLDAKPPTRVAAERRPPTRVLVEERPAPTPPRRRTAERTPAKVTATGKSFHTSRVVGLTWTGVNVVAATVCAAVAGAGTDAHPAVRAAALVVFLVFVLAAARLFVGSVRTQLKLDVGPQGLTLSNGEETTRVPWYAMSRVHIDTHRARPWVVVHLTSAGWVPKPLGRGSFAKHKGGGLRVYPVSHERYRKRRERDLVELRSALAWYGTKVYDPR
ncbi:serine/threonine-protein kinase [Saccharothrix violaceirubra]|uniref:Serine/threonine protein kinase n=1 Tax=Saccharothrix violaceirubra TaxID=413306 RepID=A0A7W7T5U3_9PSEU|nr:serine/threonine-protein kinase [Saccharothrix violaceirubra]MBB4967134.1 serine/threonine protein kinase [Saccharothrix violaceirubra]